MTKFEFIHQAIISMAGKLVDSTGSIDGAYRNNIVTEACKLANEAERHNVLFDIETVNDSLEKISDTLDAIEGDLCGDDGCGDGAINSISTSLEKMDDVCENLKTLISVLARK